VASPVELVPAKSVDTRPCGNKWRSEYERAMTPISLDDLGSWFEMYPRSAPAYY